MRQSSTRLRDTPIRLWDLTFPGQRTHVHRTRLAYIHIDHLLHFGKIDRDGRVDGYIVVWLPNEVQVLFMRGGEVVTAVVFGDEGRRVEPIAGVLARMRQEVERSDIAFIEAPDALLRCIYGAVVGPAQTRPVDPRDPGQLFAGLQQEGFSGTLELISDGAVSYFQFNAGQFVDGFFCGRGQDEPVGRFVERLLEPHEDGQPRALVATTFQDPGDLPEQAPPPLIEAYRDLYWRVAEAAEAEVPGEAMKRVEKVRDILMPTHGVLRAIGTPRDREAKPFVVTPKELTWALADWTAQLLEQLEVIAPGVAPDVLKNATREQRFVLQKAGFFERLPWTVAW